MSADAVQSCAELTFREREVAELLALGRTTREICEILKITRGTAGTHRTSILRKTRCRNLVEFARVAIAGGVVPAP